ncbi:unnamed protein product [Dovyalis caffra]|uniref:Uncharacterized protein n=1 Tax=Dovyalis caffra TaxID=77055 RepID=A0AAV1RH41_9ROSI|nr:unnamed protein product [Dovyalis caffra]
MFNMCKGKRVQIADQLPTWLKEEEKCDTIEEAARSDVNPPMIENLEIRQLKYKLSDHLD